jgi:hypothetical protein
MRPTRWIHALWRRARAEEGGWAMAITIIVTTIMVSLGLATAAWVDGQIRASGGERQRESAFNLAEGALNAQMFIMGHAWPGNATSPSYPTSCNQNSTSSLCPDPAQLAQSFDTADYKGSPTWSTEIHDNPSTTTQQCQPSTAAAFYDDTSPSPLRWDWNCDHKLWVRASATVNGVTRVIVGLVQIELQQEDLPHSALVAGSVTTTNNGNKQIICTRLPNDPSGNTCTSSSPLSGPVMVRCQPSDSNCLNFRTGQVSPDAVVTGYTGTGLTPDAVARLRQRAIDDGTYYSSGCPVSPAGAVVFVESGNCSYTDASPAPWNSPTSPGLFIVNSGTISLTGNNTYYGVIYALNAQHAAPPNCPVSLSGTVGIRGGVQIGGTDSASQQGCLSAGSSKVNIMFDDYAFNAVQSYGAANLVQNRWREIVAGH